MTFKAFNKFLAEKAFFKFTWIAEIAELFSFMRNKCPLVQLKIES